ncbi:hypothetical protein ABT56_03740 [Photobacterium aquae]|uniref:Uncharacterized protein n=1 Tax=Photobacterium aquae TaxID=1195763 RepID=A0A0J1HCC7_9GAMM|nr:hypothetical protein ABT56_03740 [Photobacterium aquae]
MRDQTALVPSQYKNTDMKKASVFRLRLLIVVGEEASSRSWGTPTLWSTIYEEPEMRDQTALVSANIEIQI